MVYNCKFVTTKIKGFTLTVDCLIDGGAYVNCTREGFNPTKYFEKTKKCHMGTAADGK